MNKKFFEEGKEEISLTLNLNNIVDNIYNINIENVLNELYDNCWYYTSSADFDTEEAYDEYIQSEYEEEEKKIYSEIEDQIIEDFRDVLGLKTEVDFANNTLKIKCDIDGLNQFEARVVEILQDYGLFYYDNKSDYLKAYPIEEEDYEARLKYASEHLGWFKHYEEIYGTIYSRFIIRLYK